MASVLAVVRLCSAVAYPCLAKLRARLRPITPSPVTPICAVAWAVMSFLRLPRSSLCELSLGYLRPLSAAARPRRRSLSVAVRPRGAGSPGEKEQAAGPGQSTLSPADPLGA